MRDLMAEMYPDDSDDCGYHETIYRGVRWDGRTHKWRSCISVCGKQFYLGSFYSEVTAAREYDAALFFLREFRAYGKSNPKYNLLIGDELTLEYLSPPSRKMREAIEFCEYAQKTKAVEHGAKYGPRLSACLNHEVTCE